MLKKNHILTKSNHYHGDQESIHSNKENADLGICRSYECVFCKRGFNTAQALGGHMNIHRKDRARNHKPNHNASKKVLFEQVNHHHHTTDCPRMYQQQMIIPGAHPSSSSYNGYNIYYGQSTNNYLEPVGLGFEVPLLINGQKIDREELDLELRLGS